MGREKIIERREGERQGKYPAAGKGFKENGEMGF